VEARQPFVPEVVADLVHLFEAAHDAALQVQLVGDPQVEGRVERLVVRGKRPGRGPPVQGLQHRGLHFEVPPRVEEGPHLGDDARAEAEHLPHLGVDGEVGVALAIAHFRIGQLAVADPARVFLPEGKRTQRLGQQRQLRGAHRDLAGPGLEQRTLNADEIAEIEE